MTTGQAGHPHINHQTYRITGNERASATARLLRLDGKSKAQPGQFAMVWIPGLGEKPFSLAAADPIELVIEPIGDFSKALCALEVGDKISLRLPLGHGFTVAGEQPVLVGGGCGAAPLRFLASAFIAAGTTPLTVLGAATEDRLILPTTWPGETLLATDDGSAGFTGTAVDCLTDHLDRHPCDGLYTCGPELMMRAVLAQATTRQIPLELSLERYMKCGLGICGHCAMDGNGLLVCTEGPVVSGTDCKCLDEFGVYRRDATGKRVPFQ